MSAKERLKKLEVSRPKADIARVILKSRADMQERERRGLSRQLPPLPEPPYRGLTLRLAQAYHQVGECDSSKCPVCLGKNDGL